MANKINVKTIKEEAKKVVDKGRGVLADASKKISQSPGITELIRANQGEKNITQKVFKDLVEQMFSDKNIFMHGILKGSDFPDIVRMIILRDFFVKYYEGCKVTYRIKRTKIHPWYEVIPNEKRPNSRRMMSATITALLQNYMKLTVSVDGKGRTDAKEIAQGARVAMEQDSFMGGFAPRLPGGPGVS